MVYTFSVFGISRRMGPASEKTFNAPVSRRAAGPSATNAGDIFLFMIDYRKYYSNYYGITWDHKKFDVHHIDGNRENNDIMNLILLPKKVHQRLHASGWFELDRYESQVMKYGISDQRIRELESRLYAIDECRRWAALRVAEYRWPWGEPMGEITEDTQIL